MAVKRIIKDALVLFLITLIAGAALGLTREVTKPIIDAAKEQKTQDAYREVFPEAAEFQQLTQNDLDLSNKAIDMMGFGDVQIDNGLRAVDAAGNKLGFVVTATSNEGYGGAVTIIAGIDTVNMQVKGISFLTLNETAGLGMKAKEPAFKDQFPGKTAATLEVVKTGNAGREQVDAISGATRTSKAVTGALNAAIYFATKCVE